MNKTMQTWIMVGGLALAALLILAGSAIASNPAGPPNVYPDAAAFQSASSWVSGWVTIAPNTCQVFHHNLGGDPDDYAVELWFLDMDDGLGIHRRNYGGLEVNGSWHGAHWQELTANTIKVCRHSDDVAADRIRIRIWIPPTSPDYDSEWTPINPGQTITFSHNLGITATDLTVGLWFSGTIRGIHHFGYGGLAVDGPQKMLGAHWHNLTDNTIQVSRHPDDTDVEQVRVILVHATPPDYDSLVALGGWHSVPAGGGYTFTHNLNWDPDVMLVRGECYDPVAGGISQWFAGGNHDWFTGWQGTNLQNLTRNTAVVFRQVNDQVCPQVRVRIWKRQIKVYLPLVLKGHSGVAFSYEASDCLGALKRADKGDQVEIWVEGRDIVMEHRGAIYNCCATMVVDLVDQRPLLQLIERETYPQSAPCDCLCPYDLSARIPGLPPGTYHVEVWNGSKTHLFGSAWVIVE
jgi:hypothetical protein